MFRSLLLAVLVGCSAEKSMYDMDNMEMGDDTEELRPQQYRIDIYPSDSSEGLLPQSFMIDSLEQDFRDILIELNPTITLSGQVEGYSINPHNDDGDVSIPGENIQVEAFIELSKSNSISSASINSDENGKYQIIAPAESDYELTITPIAPSDIPFVVTEQFDLSQSQELNVDLGFGQPIYGKFTGIGNYVDDAFVGDRN